MPILSHLSHLSLGLPSHLSPGSLSQLSYALLPCAIPPIHRTRQRPCDSAPLSVRLSPTSPSIHIPTAAALPPAALPRVPLGLTPAPDTTTAPLRGRLVSGAAGSVAGGGAGLPPHPEF
jgi:hypothetical protein